MKRKRDEPLEELWALRRRIAARYGFDPRKQAEHLQERQEREKTRLYIREKETVAAKS